MDWIESLIQNYGVAAMFVLIMLEYACFPVSSEIIQPLAGGMAAGQGLFFPYLVLLATGAGLIGALIPYGIGRFGGSPLLERIMKRFSSMEKPILTSYRVLAITKKCRSRQPRDSSVPHLYRLCRGCHGTEYQPLSFVFCHRHCYMEHGINRSWLLFLSIQRFVLSLI